MFGAAERAMVEIVGRKLQLHFRQSRVKSCLLEKWSVKATRRQSMHVEVKWHIQGVARLLDRFRKTTKAYILS